MTMKCKDNQYPVRDADSQFVVVCDKLSTIKTASTPIGFIHCFSSIIILLFVFLLFLWFAFDYYYRHGLNAQTL